MRNIFVVMTLYAASTMCGYSTSVQSRELDDLAAEADHIVCGTVTNIVVITIDGAEQTNDTAETGLGTEGNQMRLDVVVDGDGFICSTSTNRPAELHIVYGGIFNYELSWQKKWLLGKRFIFLLKGPDYAPVYSVLFNRDIADKDAILNLIRKKEQNAQQSVPAYGAQGAPSAEP